MVISNWTTELYQVGTPRRLVVCAKYMSGRTGVSSLLAFATAVNSCSSVVNHPRQCCKTNTDKHHLMTLQMDVVLYEASWKLSCIDHAFKPPFKRINCKEVDWNARLARSPLAIRPYVENTYLNYFGCRFC